jgi:hypothetical protein
MTPQKQMRLGWFVTVVTVALGVLLQTPWQALWIYRPHFSKGGFTMEPMIIWPTVILLLLPLVAAVVVILHGHWRRARSPEGADDVAS